MQLLGLGDKVKEFLLRFLAWASRYAFDIRVRAMARGTGICIADDRALGMIC